MADQQQQSHPPRTDDALAARLDHWGRRERSRLSEPGARFMSEVRSLRTGPRFARRVVTLLAAAAAIALAAIVALRADTRPSSPSGTSGTVPLAQRPAPSTIINAAAGLNTDAATVFDLLDRLPERETRDAPARAGDAYCVGCMDDLMRI